MRRKELRAWAAGHRWPIYLVGLLLLSIAAQGVMVFFATRPDAPRPLKGYYERAQAWDEDQAVRDASRQLGWTVVVNAPAGAETVAGAPRPVDVVVRDRDDRPVTGLTADVLAIRPADGRLNVRERMVELPQEPGRYRALVELGAAGVWDIGVDATRGETRFVHRVRVDVTQGTTGEAGR